MNNTKRKVAGSKGFKPGNTLNRSGPGLNTLSIVNHRGANVYENSAKRQKTNHGFSHDDSDDILGDPFGNRGLQGQRPTSRRPSSIISLNSQSQEASSQKADPFTHNEVRDVHGKLNSSKKKGRKPKTGATLQSSPRPGGTFTDPVSVDDNDDVQILGDQRSPPRSTRQPAAQRTSYGVVDGQNTGRSRAQEVRNHAKPATQVLDRVEVETPRSPLLTETFVRDDGEPDLAPVADQAQPKFKNRMQSTSNTVRAKQDQKLVEELSEDELAREPTVQTSTEKVRRTTVQQSPSPNRITSTHFTSKGRKSGAREASNIPLKSLRMQAGNWENLFLLYSWEHKLIQFIKNAETLYHEGSKIQLSSNHAQTVFCSTNSSPAVILVGSADKVSRGRIWFEFDTADDYDLFMEAVDHMNNRAKVRDLAE